MDRVINILIIVVGILVSSMFLAERTYEPPQPPQIYIQNNGVMYKVVDGELVETNEIEAGFTYTKIKGEEKSTKSY